MTEPALSGVVIADFSRVLSGPIATMLLGDLGADVIKVERPGSGDDTRAWGPPFLDGDSAYYLGLNRNKRSVALDLTTDDGSAAAHALVARADVVVENFRPGTMDRLGLGYADLARDRPDLVYCSISGFGSRNGRHLPGYDFLVQAVGGLMSITGPDPQQPQKVGVAVVDVITGLHAVVGILAALRVRDRTGQGQLIEVNLMSSLLASLVNQASNYLVAGQVPAAMGNAHPSITPYETLCAADRSIAVAVGNDRQFRALCDVLGREELADDQRFATNACRVQNRAVLVAELERQLSQRPAHDWLPLLEAASVPAGSVNTIDEAFQLAERLGLDAVIGPDDGRSPVAQVANPIWMSGTPASYRYGPPALGEHTEEVLRWLSVAPQGTGSGETGRTDGATSP